MTANAPSRRSALTDRAFVGNYLQMLVAMGIGMLVLEPLSMRVVHHAAVELEMLLMATTMVAGMVIWMVYRRHSLQAVAEMTATMYASVAVLFPFYWLGALGPKALMILGHILMVVGMAAAMLYRRESYVGA